MSAPFIVEPPPLLAIIVPAFKVRHLRRTLDSIAAQTNRRFRVYVGDDASPEDVAGVVDAYRDRLDLTYRRFPDNLGHRSLTSHWARVIALSREPWIWVFADDDVMAPDCVEAVLTACGGGDRRTLFCFEIACIDSADRPNGVTVRYPAHQTWEDFVRSMLRRPDFFWTIQNVVFSRDVFEEEGGFYDFPLGHHADYVTWAKFAWRGGIRSLPAGRVYYRQHESSIGGATLRRGGLAPLLEARWRSIEELRRLFASRGAVVGASSLTQLVWFCRFFRYRTITPAERQLAKRALASLWPRWWYLRTALFFASCQVAVWRGHGWFNAINTWRVRRLSRSHPRNRWKLS